MCAHECTQLQQAWESVKCLNSSEWADRKSEREKIIYCFVQSREFTAREISTTLHWSEIKHEKEKRKKKQNEINSWKHIKSEPRVYFPCTRVIGLRTTCWMLNANENRTCSMQATTTYTPCGCMMCRPFARTHTLRICLCVRVAASMQRIIILHYIYTHYTWMFSFVHKECAASCVVF